MAQTKNNLPYYEIPEAPAEYSAGKLASRMIDGLGFRYYWATEGLRPEDLLYTPSDSGRSSDETVNHIYGLSQFILNTLGETIENQPDVKTMSFDDKRQQTLENFKAASDILKATTDLSTFDNDRFPFWNIINGPISDAIWHCGQLVLLRRASGNPYNSKASVFSGKVRE